MSSQRIIVVGAGLAGLAVAVRLLAKGDRDVLILERAPSAGGQIHTWRDASLVVELGAEGFVARSRAVPALCDLLGISASLVDQLTTDTYAVENEELLLLPPGEAARRLGFQVPEEELGRGIRSLSRGMGQLIDALAERVGQRLRCDVGVDAIGREDHRLSVKLASGQREYADAVAVAVPARAAAELLAPLGLSETLPLASARLLSNVSVNLLYDREQLSTYPAGSGIIFPDAWASVGLRALSLVEHKFAGRAPHDQSLVRLFFRPVGDALLTWSDQRFAETASDAVRQTLGTRGQPRRHWVSRWADALPVFDPGYRAAAASADAALQPLGVHLVGSAFHGAGIDAAAKSAEMVAARLAV